MSQEKAMSDLGKRAAQELVAEFLMYKRELLGDMHMPLAVDGQMGLAIAGFTQQKIVQAKHAMFEKTRERAIQAMSEAGADQWLKMAVRDLPYED